MANKPHFMLYSGSIHSAYSNGWWDTDCLDVTGCDTTMMNWQTRHIDNPDQNRVNALLEIAARKRRVWVVLDQYGSSDAATYNDAARIVQYFENDTNPVKPYIVGYMSHDEPALSDKTRVQAQIHAIHDNCAKPVWSNTLIWQAIDSNGFFRMGTAKRDYAEINTFTVYPYSFCDDPDNPNSLCQNQLSENQGFIQQFLDAFATIPQYTLSPREGFVAGICFYAKQQIPRYRSDRANSSFITWATMTEQKILDQIKSLLNPTALGWSAYGNNSKDGYPVLQQASAYVWYDASEDATPAKGNTLSHNGDDSWGATTASLRTWLKNSITTAKTWSLGTLIYDAAYRGPTPTGSPAPSAPTGFTATAITQNSIRLAWTDNSSGAAGYKIERKVGSGAYQVVMTLSNTNGYEDVALTPSTTYDYRISAVNTSGASSTVTASATTSAAPAGANVDTIRYWPRDGYGGRMNGGKFQCSNDMSAWTDVYTISGAATEGQWTSVGVSGVNGYYRYWRYLGPNAAYCNVNEIEFYKSSAKLSGAAFGASGSWNNLGNDYRKAFDGNTDTFYDAATGNGGYCGLDFGAPPTATPVLSPVELTLRAGETGRVAVNNLDTLTITAADIYDIEVVLQLSIGATGATATPMPKCVVSSVTASDIVVTGLAEGESVLTVTLSNNARLTANVHVRPGAPGRATVAPVFFVLP